MTTDTTRQTLADLIAARRAGRTDGELAVVSGLPPHRWRQMATTPPRQSDGSVWVPAAWIVEGIATALDVTPATVRAAIAASQDGDTSG